MRIVSLLGSATEIVYALGLEASLVGISHECDHPPEALHLPRLSRTRFDPIGLDSEAVDAAVRRCMEQFGSVYEIDVDALRALRPDLILTQAVCDVCAVPTGSVAEVIAELPGEPRVASLDAHDLAGILATIAQVAEAAGAAPRGAELIHRLEGRIAAVGERVRTADRPRVLMLEWLAPPFLPGHWVPEMVAAAGGDNLAGTPGARSRQATWAELAGLDPDVLLVEPCGYGLEEASADADRHADRLSAVAPRAMDQDRAWLLHSAWFSRSGPRVVEGIEALAAILHPALSPSAHPDRARQWRQRRRTAPDAARR